MIIRDAVPRDAEAMVDLLNEIIAIGGTTAHQEPHAAADILHRHIAGPNVLASVVAEVGGAVEGWQSVTRYKGEAHIGTFVRHGGQARGLGTAMFDLTCRRCRALGLSEIIASIRADNVPGLAYYARIGFTDRAQEPGWALDDGRVVGRVHRRFAL